MATKTKSKPLSETQLVLLTGAAGRTDGTVLPPPTSLKARGAALKRVVAALLKSGLISERRAKRDDEVWRSDDNDTRLTLEITQAGLSAIGLEKREDDVAPAGNAGLENSKTSPAKKRGDSSRKIDRSPSKSRRSTNAAQQERPATKTATITALLQSTGGATIDDLMEATGWQAHSVRGFLSGTIRKKLGHTVISERQDGVRRYRIPA
ncbi:DUF3489 domain-containing protein [Microbaculum marinum]|uniref:DUF3489 domain-containing protein n=1 Tax=Microbaculum marinum TaxID=1764581 RepID=A0AAW9RHF7_9HYPH